LPRQFSSVIKIAANVMTTASPTSPQRNSRQYHLVFGFSFINQTQRASDFSVLGFGKKVFGRPASAGQSATKSRKSPSRAETSGHLS
jgi:hypothetical protein